MPSSPIAGLDAALRTLFADLEQRGVLAGAFVVVTADHSHTSQIVGEDSAGSGLPTGYSTNLTTKDGQTLSLTYGTAGYGGPGAAPAAAPPSQQHTGAVVPVWAVGPGGLDVLGTNDHTDLFQTLGG